MITVFLKLSNIASKIFHGQSHLSSSSCTKAVHPQIRKTGNEKREKYGIIKLHTTYESKRNCIYLVKALKDTINAEMHFCAPPFWTAALLPRPRPLAQWTVSSPLPFPLLPLFCSTRAESRNACNGG